jgi:hypothetical protein
MYFVGGRIERRRPQFFQNLATVMGEVRFSLQHRRKIDN